MRILDMLVEKAVQSSWITSIRYARRQRLITLTLSSGRLYTIVGASEELCNKWLESPSKGKFFHQNIKGKFKIWRIR